MIPVTLVLLIAIVCLVVARPRIVGAAAVLAFALGLIAASSDWGRSVAHFAVGLLDLFG